MATRKRNKNLNPLPEGVAVGDTIRYYLNGWRFGRLDKVQGNEAGIHTGDKTRLKWVGITDIKRVDE